MQFSNRRRRKAAISLISLVDVVFLLLIFFTVSATFMDQPAIKIDLPEATAEPPKQQEAKPMTVYLTARGELYFGDRLIRLDDLPELIHQGIAEGQPAVMTVKADREVIHGKVIEVMDVARQNGIKMVTVATQRKTEQTRR